MKVCLLYENNERLIGEGYYDQESIIQDLGLKSVFSVSAKDLVYEDGNVKKVEQEDLFLTDALRRVMMVPLRTKEEIVYRQEIVKDFLANEEQVRELYDISRDVVFKWGTLGKIPGEKAKQSNPVTRLTTDIRIIRLLCDSLSRVRHVMEEGWEPSSKGLKNFKKDLSLNFSREREENIRRVLDDISFYTDGSDEEDSGKGRTVKPRIVLESGLEDGLKLSSLKLEEVSSSGTKFYRPGSTMDKIQNFKNSLIPDSFPVVGDVRIAEQTDLLEFGVVSFLVDRIRGFIDEFQSFFTQLKFQSGFYLAAVQLKAQMERFGVGFCYPEVCGNRDMEFADLKELVMAVEQRVVVIGNSCRFDKKDLLIITGANQGGKSTFLRSIGIAQVMMQCGLPVAAARYKSGIFPGIFVHFTRREDSEMNSGRLDEELKRMNGIVENLREDSLLLLNESFATTTEKEGSVIAYDIIKALVEAGVRIFTVTHLLSFARRVHEEMKDDPDSAVEFLSAERKENGVRTYRMIRHEPELTSFGLDLYEEIVEKNVSI